MISGGDEVGDVGVQRDPGRLLEEADDNVRRRSHRVKDVAGVDDEIDIPLQNGVHRPPVSLLYINLPLVTARPRAQLRVPRVPEVRVRDMSDPYDLSPPFGPVALYGRLTRLQRQLAIVLAKFQVRAWCWAISSLITGTNAFGTSITVWSGSSKAASSLAVASSSVCSS